MYNPVIMFEPEIIKAGEPRKPKAPSVFSLPLHEALELLEDRESGFAEVDFRVLQS